ncbi:M48 family metallopeptidase [Stakelama saccharophila]|uniref:SprT family zinc-dependent metalloprotease n=1 Tax=Stakelama saccharophila TaxID=3075605 RepID=A0ABZ0B9A5_9SPHN|nr:SprT family zinc-dependent metalloprotease [Stakelama sp. W311]WNO53990.1 SprT family zinc-dependent metalloprotease [Stakelama sp. W311]
MRLSVDPATGTVRLTIPKRASERAALAWAATQKRWIAAQRARLPRPVPFADGALLPLDDRDVRLTWRADAPRGPELVGDRLLVGGPEHALARRTERWLRERALAVLRAETIEFAARAGVTVTGVAIGDPRGRWGSCSSDGAIRYSWRLILAPAHVRRATVAHEIAHRVHMNHSPAFHALVAAIADEDPQAARAWLRRHGARLHWFGREP